MRGLIGAVCYKCMDIRELLYYLVVNIIKGNAVVYIAGGNFYCQNNTMNITGGMGFIGQLLLVVAFHEQTTFWVCGANSNSFLLCFLLALFQLLFGSVIPFLFRRRGWIIVVIIVRIVLKGVLSVGFPVGVHLIHKLLGIPFRRNRHFLLYKLSSCWRWP